MRIHMWIYNISIIAFNSYYRYCLVTKWFKKPVFCLRIILASKEWQLAFAGTHFIPLILYRHIPQKWPLNFHLVRHGLHMINLSSYHGPNHNRIEPVWCVIFVVFSPKHCNLKQISVKYNHCWGCIRETRFRIFIWHTKVPCLSRISTKC